MAHYRGSLFCFIVRARSQYRVYQAVQRVCPPFLYFWEIPEGGQVVVVWISSEDVLESCQHVGVFCGVAGVPRVHYQLCPPFHHVGEHTALLADGKGVVQVDVVLELLTAGMEIQGAPREFFEYPYLRGFNVTGS